MFLTTAELAELTGYRRPSAQARWLARAGMRFVIGGDGAIKVLQAEVERHQTDGCRSEHDTSDDACRPWKQTGQSPAEWLAANFESFVFSAENIVKSSQPYSTGAGEWGAGIYFLVDGGKIVYVGRSTNIAQRIDKHYVGPKQFSHFWCFTMPLLLLPHVESYYIAQFQPKYNVAP